MTERVIQEGTGTPRPLVLVYHIGDAVDPAIRAAVGPRALVIGVVEQGTDYQGIPSLQSTVASLEQRYATKLAPVIVAGFSAGGFATRRILQLGGLPDALVVADGTYASTPEGWAPWQAYALRAEKGQGLFLATHTSLVVPSATWRVLKAISGLDLPLGPNAQNRPPGTPILHGPGPVRHTLGQFVIDSYPTDDGPGHTRQGAVVLPQLLHEAMQRLGAGKSSGAPLAFLGAALAGVFLLRARRSG